MDRILREAEQEQEKELAKDLYIILNKVREVKERNDISDEQKNKMTDAIIQPKLAELKQMIESYKGKQIESCWDFGTEKLRMFLWKMMF